MTGEKRIRGERDRFNKKEKGKTEMRRLGLPKASRTICPGWPREKLWKREVSKERTHGGSAACARDAWSFGVGTWTYRRRVL